MSSTAPLELTALPHQLQRAQPHVTELEHRNRDLLEARNRDLEEHVRDLAARVTDLEGRNRTSSELRLQQLEERKRQLDDINRQLEGQLQVLQQEAEKRVQRLEQHVAALQRSAAEAKSEARRLVRRYEFDEGEQLVIFVAQRLLETWDLVTQRNVMQLTKATCAELLPRITHGKMYVGHRNGRVCHFARALGLRELTLMLQWTSKANGAYPDATPHPALECQLGFLKHLTGLTTIRLDGRHLDLMLPSGLAHQCSLSELHIDCSAVDGLQQLSALSRLAMLGFEDCKVDLAKLPTLQCLRSLCLSRFRDMLDVQQLARHTTLQHLDINTSPYGMMKHVEQLAALTALRKLRIFDQATDPGITGLEPLSLLISLTCLVLNFECRPPPLELLAPLTRLQRLEVEPGNGDLSPISTLQALRRLRVWGYRVSDLTPLTQLTALEHLRIDSYRKPLSVAPLMGLKSLRSLNLKGCKVVPEDLRPLAKQRHPKVKISY